LVAHGFNRGISVQLKLTPLGVAQKTFKDFTLPKIIVKSFIAFIIII